MPIFGTFHVKGLSRIFGVFVIMFFILGFLLPNFFGTALVLSFRTIKCVQGLMFSAHLAKGSCLMLLYRYGHREEGPVVGVYSIHEYLIGQNWAMVIVCAFHS